MEKDDKESGLNIDWEEWWRSSKELEERDASWKEYRKGREKDMKELEVLLGELKEEEARRLVSRSRERPMLTSEKVGETGGSVILGVIAFVVIILLIYGVFIGGRAIYREGQHIITSQDTTAVGRLETKISDISGLKSRIDSKRIEIVRLDKFYKYNMQKLRDEVRKISRSSNVSTYNRAIRNQKIKNRLVLLQQIFAYREIIGKIIADLDAGYEEADFIERKAENDLKIARVFSREGRDELIRMMNEVMSRYSAKADMDVSQLTIVEGAQVEKSLEDVWKWVNQK